MGVFCKLLLLAVLVPCVFCQEPGDCFSAGSVAGAAIGAFLAALLLVAAAYYLRKLYWKSRKGKHLVFSTDPESVKDEFAFDNPGFREEKQWQHDAPTLPLAGKNHALHAEFTTPEHSRDDTHLQRARVRRVKLWARDFTGLGLRCGGGAREGVHVHSVLRSGPAAAANLQPGDKIKSIKIEFTGTPLEDAVSILSLASPYPVELEVMEGARVSGEGTEVLHPLLKRAGSMGDVNQLEKEGKLLHPPKSPNTSNSNNSTLETKHPKGIKKMITEKIITSTTLERNKKEKKDSLPTTLERENEKNAKLSSKTRYSDVPPINSKPDRTKIRHSTGTEIQMIQQENGIAHMEQAEVQKRESDPKKAMKFGIRVLPPNIPDDGVLQKQKSIENGAITIDKKSIDEPDKTEPPKQAPVPQLRHENETEQKKPVVAKRREKLAPPIPNVRIKSNDSDINLSQNSSRTSENSFSTFTRTEMNSSGIKRDENGIPQELPQHMLNAANAARSNRKSSIELLLEKDKLSEKENVIVDSKKEEAPKLNKKSKGKAPSPPEETNKSDDSILEQMLRINDFLKNEKQHSSLLHETSFSSQNRSSTSFNTSTPKTNKSQSGLSESINFSQDDIDDIVSKPFRRESDSLNNFYEDTKSNLSSNQDIHSVVSLNHSDKSDKGSTTIELNNSDITIHSSPTNEMAHSVSETTSVLDESERKAASLGDLSRFEIRTKTITTSGTLERAQSLDISADDAEVNESTLSPKKRKAMSVVESTFLETGAENMPDIDTNKGVVIKHKEPRLSLNIAKTSAIEGLNTFQRNRLKKGSEFGNLEDAIVKGSNSSLEYENNDSNDSQDLSGKRHYSKDFDLSNINESHETSDNLARRIMDENLKVHFKLVSEFAKSTSDGSNMSSLEYSQPEPHSSTKTETGKKFEEKISMTYDTNIPDDMKVSRNTYANSLERPKSDMMKKLLAKNSILNVHVDQTPQRTEVSTSVETPTPMTDASKSAIHQPDIVNFDLKPIESRLKNYDDYVSNIRVGSNNNSLKYDKKMTQKELKSADWSESKEISSQNIVTISTNEKNQSSDEEKSKTYTKSIEIGEPTIRLIPDVIEGVQKRGDEREGRTLYMEPGSMSLTMTQEPVQKTVTVNVIEDEFGNKVITQNVEKVSTKYINTKTEVPLQVEQISFGIMKNPGDINQLDLEEGNVKDIDRKFLEEIKKQNPNIHFTSSEPAFTRTETIILNTELDEEQAKELMEKIQNDPSFMAQKTPEELSRLGIRIIHDLEDIQNTSDTSVETVKTRYSINPMMMGDSQKCGEALSAKDSKSSEEHVTEIQVLTPKTEKLTKAVSSKHDKIASRQRAPAYEDSAFTYELDLDLLSDFISNERHHTAKQINETKKRTKTNQSTNEPKKRHSDFDLPRNPHIMFRTSTYESPKGTIVTSTDLENRRQSQLDQMQLRQPDPVIGGQKPTISAKPSNIPIKADNKSKQQTPLSPGVSSKIPIFTSQKSLSQENLIMEKNISLPRSPPPRLSNSSGNISITSIKSSSKSPSGGKM